MACKRPLWPVPLLFVALGTVTRGVAQVRALVTELGYQSPSLVVPVILLSSTTASGARAWTGGLIGSTLTTTWTSTANPARSTVAGVELTPFGSHSSSYVYRGGRRDASLGFRDRTVRLNAGVRLRRGPAWRLDVRAIGLYESVAGLADSTVPARWKAPYLGLGVEAGFNHIVAEDPLDDRWDGFKVAGSAEAFAGTRPWWKSQLSLGAGRQVGRVTLRGRAWVLLGHNLDVVNQHLVGGSWELGGGPLLYGYRYAEFRVDRAVVLGGGVDLRLGGTWNAGFRLGYLTSPTRTTYGETVNVSTTWNGIGLHLGIGLPRASLFRREADQPMLFAWLTAVAL